jgi:hypothetical protein
VFHCSAAALVEEAVPLRNKAAVIGTVLKCHSVVESFVNVGFTAHPELVKAMTTFMLTERVDPEQMSDLESKFKVLKADASAISKENSDFKTTQTDLKKKTRRLDECLQRLQGISHRFQWWQWWWARSGPRQRPWMK